MIILKQYPDQRFTLWAVDDNQHISQTLALETLSDFPEDYRNDHLTILLDGTSLRMTETTLPRMSAQELKQAVPFALENTLSEPIDQLYFAIGPADTKQKRPVCVINKLRWQTLLDTLQHHGLKPTAIVPDFLCIPLEKGKCSIAIDGEHSLVRFGDNDGFAIDTASLPTLLVLTLQRHPDIKTLHIYSEDQQQSVEMLRDTRPDTQLTIQSLDKTLQVNVRSSHYPFDLLKGSAQSNAGKPQEGRYWRYCLTSILTFIGIIFCGELALYAYYKNKASDLNIQITTAYQAIFPGAKTVTEPKLRISAALNAYSVGTNTFLSMMSRLGQGLSNNKAIKLKTVNFQDQALTITLQTKDLYDLNTFTKALTAQGFSIKENQSKTVDKKIQAKLTIG